MWVESSPAIEMTRNALRFSEHPPLEEQFHPQLTAIEWCHQTWFSLSLNYWFIHANLTETKHLKMLLCTFNCHMLWGLLRGVRHLLRSYSKYEEKINITIKVFAHSFENMCRISVYPASGTGIQTLFHVYATEWSAKTTWAQRKRASFPEGMWKSPKSNVSDDT